MKILFFGTPNFGAEILEHLKRQVEVVAVVCQPDKPFGRKKILTPPKTKLVALESNIAVMQPLKLDSIFLSEIASLEFDLIVVVAYGKIFPKELVRSYTCINIHISFLPELRGATPLQQLLLQDSKIISASFIKMDEGLDSGDCIGYLVESRAKFEGLYIDEIFSFLALRVSSFLLKLLSDEFIFTKQHGCTATYCNKTSKEDGMIDFSDARDIYLKELVFSNWPCVQYKKDSLSLKLHKISLIEHQSSNKAGEILGFKGSGVILGALKGSVLVEEITMQSKKKNNAKSFLQSRGLSVGDVL